MNCLSWNCQGLGNPRIVLELHLLVKNKNLHFVFLIETKCRRTKVDCIRNKLGYDCNFVVDSRGRSGVLAMLWHSDSLVSLDS